MLVLSRKQKQQIRIGDDVVVTILQIKGGSVRIGIEAPREVHVMRGELETFPQVQQTESEAPQREILSINAGTDASGKHSSDAHCESIAEEESGKEILELKFHGGESKRGIIPTRLTEIANAIPSLNLPR